MDDIKNMYRERERERESERYTLYVCKRDSAFIITADVSFYSEHIFWSSRRYWLLTNWVKDDVISNSSNDQ